MEKENAAIHDFDFNLITQYFASLQRQGPGSAETTIKALSFIDNLTDKTKIADLACGTGGQTIVLAQNTKAFITALDLSTIFVDKLNENAKKLGLENRIKGIAGSMDNLPFEKNSFDIVWCEGAIDEMGYEKGLNYWKNFLKKDGYIAVSNLVWFKENPPKEIEKFLLNAVKDMGTTASNILIMQKAGFIPIAAFALSEHCWTKNYYIPQEMLYEPFLKKYAGNKAAESFIELMKYEAILYSKYKQYYGYVFCIGKKL